MHIHFVGTGDAFGSGGRYNTCFHLDAGTTRILVDCGASAFHGLKQTGLDRDGIDALLFTHFHGDHFGGLPYFLLDAQFVTRRRKPLVLAGPPGVEAACVALVEASYPGYARGARDFSIEYREIAPGATVDLCGLAVTAYPVQHDPNLAHCFGYRIGAGEKIFAYSGDTTWTDTLFDLGRGADLFVVECYVRDRPMKVHMDYATLRRHLPAIGARRVLLTHMSPDILDNAGEIDHEMVHDGLTVRL